MVPAICRKPKALSPDQYRQNQLRKDRCAPVEVDDTYLNNFQEAAHSETDLRII